MENIIIILALSFFFGSLWGGFVVLVMMRKTVKNFFKEV